MEQSETIEKLAAALAVAQGKIEGSRKDAANPFFKNQYSTLSSVWEACREQLSANGLSIVQTSNILPEHPDLVIVETQINHSSGQWIRGRIAMRPVKNDPQGIGSCITYARRYSLAAMVGVAPEDDDGNAASGKAANKERDYSKPIELWKAAVIDLAKDCTIEAFRAFWGETKAEITHDCGTTGAAEVYQLYVETGKKLAGAA